MYDMIICSIAAFLVGCLFTLLTMNVIDTVSEKKEAKARKNPFGWCGDGCKHYEACFARHKDPDIATAELVHRYCSGCPMERAYEILQEAMDGNQNNPG